MTMLTAAQTDVLSELMNIGVGRASATLNSMVGHHIQLHVPYVTLIQKEFLRDYLPYPPESLISGVNMAFEGTFEGSAALLFPQEAASVLVSSLTDEPQDSLEMGELKSGTLTEIGNILINGVMGSIANILDAGLKYSVPDYMECEMEQLGLLSGASDATVLLAETSFNIDELKVQGNIILFFCVSSFDNLLQYIDRELAV